MCLHTGCIEVQERPVQGNLLLIWQVEGGAGKVHHQHQGLGGPHPQGWQVNIAKLFGNNKYKPYWIILDF